MNGGMIESLPRCISIAEGFLLQRLARRSRISSSRTTSRGGGRFGGLGHELVHGANQQEKREGDDQEIEGGGQERTETENRAHFLGVGIGRMALDVSAERKVIIREVEAAGNRADDGHDQIADD